MTITGSQNKCGSVVFVNVDSVDIHPLLSIAPSYDLS